MVTGDLGSLSYFPMNAVRWKTVIKDFAALGTASGTDRFSAKVFHFGHTTRTIEADLFLLEKGIINTCLLIRMKIN